VIEQIDHQRTIRETLAASWRHKRRTDIADLVSQNYRLSPAVEAEPGAYDLADIPWYREILDCMGDREVRELVVLKSTQVVGTVSTQGGMIALAVADPAPAMIVAPTQDESRKVRDRIYLNTLASRPLFRQMVPPERLWNMQAVELGSAILNLAWSGSAQRLRGKPCKRVLLTECDVYEVDDDVGDPVQAAQERTKQFFDSLIIYESTPVGDDSKVFAKFETCRKHFWWFACPHCSRWQPIRFFLYQRGELAGRGGLAGCRDSAGNLRSPDEARERARYICINGCEIDQSWKTSMIRAGRWVAEGQHIDRNGKLVGAPAVASRARMGFHVWSMMSSKITFGDIAAKYCRLVPEGLLRDFFQNDLGLRFRQAKPVPKWETIASTYSTPFTSGTVPTDCLFLTSGIDVQESHLLWVVVGWSHSRTPWLIDWGEFERRTVGGSDSTDSGDGMSAESGVIIDSDLSQIEPGILSRTWTVNGLNPIGRAALPVRLLGIDSRYRRAQVLDFVRRMQTDRVRAMQGVDRLASGKPFDASEVDRDATTGKTVDDSVQRWNIWSAFYQEQMEERLVAAPGGPKAFRLPEDILPGGKKLLRQLTNVRRNQRGVWEKINGQLGEDYRDCLKLAEAAADMVLGPALWEPTAWSAYVAQLNKAREAAAAKRPPRESQTILDR
jgi:phage terminase large subunit GpA-like protein